MQKRGLIINADFRKMESDKNQKTPTSMNSSLKRTKTCSPTIANVRPEDFSSDKYALVLKLKTLRPS